MPHLVVMEPDAEPTVYPLEGKIVTVGRTPANHIRIGDGAASRKHCMIKASRDTYTLVDLGSANGTIVNGDKVKEFDLSEGDRIKIGNTVLVFKEG